MGWKLIFEGIKSKFEWIVLDLDELAELVPNATIQIDMDTSLAITEAAERLKQKENAEKAKLDRFVRSVAFKGVDSISIEDFPEIPKKEEN
jgi:enoyl-[acyl-carrier-protein] reductase (NADH)